MMLASSGHMLIVPGWMTHYIINCNLYHIFSWQCPSCLFTVLPSDKVCDCEDTTLSQSPAGYLSLELALPVDILCESFNGI